MMLVSAVDPLLKYFAPIGVVTVYALTDRLLWRTATGNGPLPVQIILATLVIEFDRY
jgi:hypothetical protein